MNTTFRFKAWNALQTFRIHHKQAYRYGKYIYLRIKNKGALEHKTSYGTKNPNTTIYIIRPPLNTNEGLMSLFNKTAREIDFAYRKGYIPVVDWKNYPTQYSDNHNDVWDYYFEQPGSISIAEAYESKNVIESGYTMNDQDDMSIFSRKGIIDDGIIIEGARSSKAFADAHIRIKKEWLDIIETESKRLDITECIGLYARGTDYTSLKPVGEPIQPTMDMLIEKAEQYKTKYGGPIFLVTEDKKIADEIKERIQDVRTIHDDILIDNYTGKDYLSRASKNTDMDKRLSGGIYLVKILLLSKCKYFIGGTTQGTVASIGFNGGLYDDAHIFDLGYYTSIKDGFRARQ